MKSRLHIRDDVDGIAEDIITLLSKSRALFVIARNSTFTYKGRAADIKEVGQELGVRYVLEGNERKASSQCALDSLAPLAAPPSMAGHIVIGDRAPDQNYRQLGSPRSKLASNLVALLIRSHCFVDDLAQQPVIRHLRMKSDVPWAGTGAGFDEGRIVRRRFSACRVEAIATLVGERMYRLTAALVALIALGMSAPAAAQSSDAALTLSLQRALDTYVATRAEPEHISAASLSISLEGAEKNINLAAGTTKYPNAGAKITPADLFQIGSITKSFTSVAILHLATPAKLASRRRSASSRFVKDCFTNLHATWTALFAPRS